MNYDVIIIGSGLAGLSAGAKLTKAGKKVLILEQHKIVGGCATCFKRDPYTFDVSLHELNGVGRNKYSYPFYQDLNVLENLTFLKIPEFYRFIGPDIDIVVPNNIVQVKRLLLEKFPHEERGIHTFFKVIFKIRSVD